MKCLKNLNLFFNKTILEIGGGLSPLQFILANNNCKVYNLDMNFSTGWFPIKDKYYLRASDEFVDESNRNINNIHYIEGDIIKTIKNIPSESIDCAIDTCAMHIFISNELIDEISRILKPGGYLLSIGDTANPYLGRCDKEFMYPPDMLEILSSNEKLKIVHPYNYTLWEQELKDYKNIIPRTNINYNNLSLINMIYDPDSIPYGNIPSYPISIWPTTFLLIKN